MKDFAKDFLHSMRMIAGTTAWLAGNLLRTMAAVSAIAAFNMAPPICIATRLDTGNFLVIAGISILWLAFSLPVTVSLAYAYFEYRKRKFMANTIRNIQETKVPGEKE